MGNVDGGSVDDEEDEQSAEDIGNTDETVNTENLLQSTTPTTKLTTPNTNKRIVLQYQHQQIATPNSTSSRRTQRILLSWFKQLIQIPTTTPNGQALSPQPKYRCKTQDRGRIQTFLVISNLASIHECTRNYFHVQNKLEQYSLRL